MSNLTSQQRKLAYLIGILVLLAPIIIFGLPSDGKEGTGGALANLRRKYDLGESNLGNVDPSSLTMNLVLLGLRGIAVNQLWIQMDTAKTNKDWSRMLEATQSIVKLQPHYEKVWDFNGWNLAWNTSVEWDAVPDRYYWVKEGGKFMLQGIERNQKSTELRLRAATIYQKKIGIADEAAFFRKYFLVDPDTERWHNGPDTDFNRGPAGPYPEGKDNYVVAHEWYKAGVDNENRWNVPQHVTDRTTFHAMPARCLFDYAQALQKEGQFGEITRVAWSDALDEWVNKFGNEILISPVVLGGGQRVIIRYKLEATDEDIRALSSTPEEEAIVRKTIDDFQKIVNYRYWRTRGMSEAEPETADAHRMFFEAGEKYKEQNWREALPLVEAAMKGFENVMARYPDLRFEDSMVEECMLAVQMWINIYKLEIGDNPPADFPLRPLWQENQGRMPEIEREFRRRFLLQAGQ